VDPGRYRRLIGKLIYLTVIRPDITFVVGLLYWYMQAPYQLHWDVTYHILRYVKGTPGRGLFYQPSSHLGIVGYSDADWAGNPIDYHSISGCTFVGGNLVTWHSKKQTVIA